MWYWCPVGFAPAKLKISKLGATFSTTPDDFFAKKFKAQNKFPSKYQRALGSGYAPTLFFGISSLTIKWILEYYFFS